MHTRGASAPKAGVLAASVSESIELTAQYLLALVAGDFAGVDHADLVDHLLQAIASQAARNPSQPAR